VTGRPRIAIVGGGLAGIAAALDCADAGAAVTLLEVRPRLGGAAYSFEREGLAVDNGQHVFLRCCTEYRSLLARLGAEHDVVLQERLEIPVLRPDGRTAMLRRNGAPAPLHLAGALARYRLLTPRQRLGVARAMLALRGVDPDDPANDARAFGGWLDEQRQGEAEIQAIWRLIVLPTLNLEPAQASLAQVAQVFQVGLLHDAGAGDIGYARVPLSQLHDEPARRTLARAGVDVRLRWRAERVVPRAGGACRIEGGEGPVDADAVVVAVPHGRAAALLPPEAAVDPTQLERLGSSPIVNVHVVYDRRVLETPFAAGVDTPVQWLFDRGSPAGVAGGQYVAVSVSAADDEQSMDPDTLREHYLTALAALLPAARGARVERCFVTREHAATFRAAPGARALRPGPRTGLPSIVLAGSWTDTAWPATMEGAVRSGQTAAGVALAAVPHGSQRAAVTA
jgi:squalene-associated FAD-dependent desaturase